jgi:hypothetical protein
MAVFVMVVVPAVCGSIQAEKPPTEQSCRGGGKGQDGILFMMMMVVMVAAMPMIFAMAMFLMAIAVAVAPMTMVVGAGNL